LQRAVSVYETARFFVGRQLSPKPDENIGTKSLPLDNQCYMCYINIKGYIKGEVPMKRFLNKITDMLADAALLEMGVDVPTTPRRSFLRDSETLEENLIEVAFAEEADYDDIHEAILREHRQERDVAHPDDCQYGDNDLCFV
jgi:hypothetical protein